MRQDDPSPGPHRLPANLGTVVEPRNGAARVIVSATRVALPARGQTALSPCTTRGRPTHDAPGQHASFLATLDLLIPGTGATGLEPATSGVQAESDTATSGNELNSSEQPHLQRFLTTESLRRRMVEPNVRSTFGPRVGHGILFCGQRRATRDRCPRIEPLSPTRPSRSPSLEQWFYRT